MEYSLKRQNGEWVVSHRKISWFSEVSKSETVDDKFANGIIRVLKRNKAHKMGSLSIFDLEYTVKKLSEWTSTDGTTYSFYMEFSDGRVVQFKEYDNCPGSYRTILHAFERRCGALFGE